MENRPLVGMPARMDPGTEKQYLSRHYADAVLEAGGLPLILPLLEPPEAVSEVASRLDGLLLTGSSSDVDPAHYGATRHPKCGPNQPLRDGTDFVLLRIALEQRIPVLGICYGMQSLNVFLGGSLVQDIPTEIRTGIRHSNSETASGVAHHVRIEPGSKLGLLAGEAEPGVNSTHHQAVDRPGSGLRVIAYAPDGVVEAVELDGPNHWVLGVQWHPERTSASDRFSRRIFAEFVAQCRAGKGRS